ncbi:phenylalanine--tRNA ligase subunit beta [Neisseriaceae bacterium CLB008]
MQFSYDWLKTWVNPNLAADKFAHVLTMAGLEVEEAERPAPDFSGVVVAEVKSVVPHPNADRLRITQVDIGSGELVQIVCGAPNVVEGAKVPCATSGALLPGDFKIKPTKMRGEVSNGMLCSGKELGLPDDVDGLLILPSDAPVGTDIREYLQLNDDVFTLKITPNRADCLSIRGIAREVAALTHLPVNEVAIKEVAVGHDQAVHATIAAPEHCGRFLTRQINLVNAQAATPDWMKQRLLRSGVRSISALVDITNYVMLELGQPMHAFDADTLQGDLVVRMANEGEVLECLNEKTVTLSANTLVVADEEQALSIAGLMGGEASSVTDATQNIVLESAFFAPDSIAGKSRQYGFGSDSSFRFERGVDFELQALAMARASELVIDICGGDAGPVIEALGQLPQQEAVNVRTARVNKILGTDISAEQIHTILTDLGLQPQANAEGFATFAPSFRFDITREVDLIEEVARVYGYENIPSDQLQGRLAMLPLSETMKPRQQVYRQMAGKGYQEVINYAFVDEAWEQDFAHNLDPIRLKNPIASHMNVMRSTLLGGLVDALVSNLNRKQNRVRVFEVARVFAKTAAGEYDQTEKLAALAYGTVLPEQWGAASTKVDFYTVKADVENLLAGKDVRFEAATHPALHPGRCADILLDGQKIGFMGELHPSWVHKYDLPQAPIVFELNFAATLAQAKVTYAPTSKYQAGRRDLAFVLPQDQSAQSLLDALKQVKHELIQDVRIFDLYQGDSLAEGMKSLAVSVHLQDMHKTLVDEEVDQLITKLIDSAKLAGAHLRN